MSVIKVGRGCSEVASFVGKDVSDGFKTLYVSYFDECILVHP